MYTEVTLSNKSVLTFRVLFPTGHIYSNKLKSSWQPSFINLSRVLYWYYTFEFVLWTNFFHNPFIYLLH